MTFLGIIFYRRGTRNSLACASYNFLWFRQGLWVILSSTVFNHWVKEISLSFPPLFLKYKVALSLFLECALSSKGSFLFWKWYYDFWFISLELQGRFINKPVPSLDKTLIVSCQLSQMNVCKYNYCNSHLSPCQMSQHFTAKLFCVAN